MTTMPKMPQDLNPAAAELFYGTQVVLDPAILALDLHGVELLPDVATMAGFVINALHR